MSRIVKKISGWLTFSIVALRRMTFYFF